VEIGPAERSFLCGLLKWKLLRPSSIVLTFVDKIGEAV